MDAKTKIIKAAIKVFLMKGFEATSINDVVEESKISKGGIYHHFKNKKELFLKTIDFMFDEFEKWEMDMYTKYSNIKDILRTYFASLSYIHEFVTELAGSEEIEIDSFYMLMMDAFVKFPQIKKKHAKTHQDSLQYFIALLENAKKEGKIKENLDCATLAFMINAVAEGTVLYHILNEKIDLDAMGDKIFRTIWQGIARE